MRNLVKSDVFSQHFVLFYCSGNQYRLINLIEGDAQGVSLRQICGGTKNNNGTISINGTAGNGIVVNNSSGHPISVYLAFTASGTEGQIGQGTQNGSLPTYIMTGAERERYASRFTNIELVGYPCDNNKSMYWGLIVNTPVVLTAVCALIQS